MRLIDKVTRLSCDQQSIDVLPLCKDFTIEHAIAVCNLTILSHTTPSKAVISPLLPLNSCAVVIENAFCGMKIK